MGLTLEISEEQLKTAFDSHITKILSDTYDNPVKRVVDEILGYSSKSLLKEELNKKISTYIETLIQSKDFTIAVGEAFAREIARREADKLKK